MTRVGGGSWQAGEARRYRSGFAAIVGRPNVGKSTLLNALVGQKVAITSPLPQTTRNQIQGVMNSENAQVVFIDTPGIHQPKHRLGQWMVKAAVAALSEVDLILMVMDAADVRFETDASVIARLKDTSTPVYLVVNKVDAVRKPDLLQVIDRYRTLHPFVEIVPISAKTGIQLEELKQLIVNMLPAGPQYYPDGMLTDHPERFLIAEIIREKVLHLTREEVPHSVAVEIEQLERGENGVVRVHAVIYTERESQKGILIGRRGLLLKQVGQLARRELEALLGSKVYLELWVKVRKGWRNEASLLRRFGFDERP